jgi:hypothetical protein
MLIEIETVVSIMFYSIGAWMSYRMNHSLHEDIFDDKSSQYNAISEVDNKEYLILKEEFIP